jgi:O-antigen/teichoic acid export membrane protein
MLQKNTIVTLGTQVGIQGIGLITGVVVARLLGPGGRGELAAIIAWVSMIAYLGNIGLPVAYTFAAAREPNRIRQLVGNGVLAVISQWVILAVVGWVVLRVAFTGKAQDTHQLASFYLLLYVPLNLFTLYINAILQGTQKFQRFNMVRLSVPVAYLAGLGAIFLLGHATLAGVLSANLVSNLAALLLAIFLIVPVLKEHRSSLGLVSGASLWRDIRYGISAHVGNLQPFSTLRIDVLLLSILLPAHDLGLYVAALAGATLIKAQGIALGMVVMPEMARASEISVQRRVVIKFGGVALGLGSAAAIIALVWADPLVKVVFGEPFTAAAPVLRWLVGFAVLSSLQRVLADALRGLGRPFNGTVAEFASLIVGVPAIFWLTPMQGTTGAAIAVGLAAVAGLAVTVPGVLHALKEAEHLGDVGSGGANQALSPGEPK